MLNVNKKGVQIMAVHLGQHGKPTTDPRVSKEFAQPGTNGTIERPTAETATQNEPPFVRRTLADLVQGQGWGISVPYNETNQIAQKFMHAFQKVSESVEGLKDRSGWEFLTFTPMNSLISSILFVRFNETHAVAYTFLLEKTLVQPLSPRTFTFQNHGLNNTETVSIPSMTEELWTTERTYSDAVRDYVSQRFPGKKVVLASALVINRYIEDTEENKLRRNLFYANVAAQSVLNAIEGTSPSINLAESGQDENLSVRIKFDNAAQVATATGLPVRDSLAIELVLNNRANRPNNYQQTLFNNNNTQVLGNLLGYMDFHYIGDQQQPTLNAYGQLMPVPQWQPALVITAVDQPTTVQTLHQYLLTLSAAASAIVNNLWKLSWRPNNFAKQDEANVFDIGVITALAARPGVNVLAATDTRDSSFNFEAFMNENFTKDVLIELIVRELGEANFIERTLLEAAGIAGNDKRNTAEQAILAAADELTNGNFSARWNTLTNGAHVPLVVSDIGRVEQGFYVNQRGEHRALSFIDSLWLANTHAQGGDELANAWMDTYNPTKGTVEQRISRRLGILETVMSGAYTITDYAQRLTVNPLFLQALSEAVHACKAIAFETQHNTGIASSRGFVSAFGGLNAQQVQGAYAYSQAGVQGGNPASRSYYYAAGATPAQMNLRY